MARHEQPQRPAQVYYPPGHPKNRGAIPRPPIQNTAAPMPGGKEPDQAATVADKEDLGDMIRAIDELANTLHDEFFNIPGLTDDNAAVDPESFNAATRLAFVSAGNALDYAIRLVKEKGSAARIKKLRVELAREMQAAGLVGDPAEDGESPTD